MDGWTFIHPDERERKPRNGVNVTGLRNQTGSSELDTSRARRLSRHYLDRAIKCRQCRVDRSHDSRINDSDVPWRNAFRTASRSQRRTTTQMRLFRVRTAEFSKRAGEARACARDAVAYKTNSIYRYLCLRMYVTMLCGHSSRSSSSISQTRASHVVASVAIVIFLARDATARQ